jgi:hypothetical protein
MLSRLNWLLALALPAAVPVSVSHAEEIKVSGTIVYVTVSEQSSKLPDGRTVLHLHDKGILRTEDPASPIHLAIENCFSTIILAADGSIENGSGYCDTFDKEGDANWLTWVGTATGTAWTIYHGTGKFEGMTGSGTTTFDLMLPDRSSGTFEGTLTMK